MYHLWVGLPHLRNLVNVYTSSLTETIPFTRNFQIYFFFIMQLRKIVLNPLKNVPCANIDNCFWSVVEIDR